jgi:hypothetical protein
MLGIMTARCGQCGHENNPEYRFCGICGAPLEPAIRTREAGMPRPPARVSGPSFLGLGDDHTRDLDYLLEDDPPRGHGRLYLALLLLIVSAALLAWYWRDGNPWTALLQRPQSKPPAVATPAPVPVPTSEPVASAVPPQAQPVATEKAAAAPPPTAEPAGGSAPSASPAEAVKPPDQTPEANDHAAAGESAAKAQTAPAPVATQAEAPGEEETETSIPKPTPALPSTHVSKTVPGPQAVIPPVSPEDKLVAEGERYLYGRGVRPDCALAQRDLLIGAQRSNTKAQTMLGAMYATGHCVNRDLPTAYRWFAKALHGDPGNSRVQRDLEVLWKQMTPEERQLAMKSQ